MLFSSRNSVEDLLLVLLFLASLPGAFQRPGYLTPCDSDRVTHTNTGNTVSLEKSGLATLAHGLMVTSERI